VSRDVHQYASRTAVCALIGSPVSAFVTDSNRQTDRHIRSEIKFSAIFPTQLGSVCVSSHRRL